MKKNKNAIYNFLKKSLKDFCKELLISCLYCDFLVISCCLINTEDTEEKVKKKMCPFLQLLSNSVRTSCHVLPCRPCVYRIPVSVTVVLVETVLPGP